MHSKAISLISWIHDEKVFRKWNYVKIRIWKEILSSIFMWSIFNGLLTLKLFFQMMNPSCSLYVKLLVLRLIRKLYIDEFLRSLIFVRPSKLWIILAHSNLMVREKRTKDNSEPNIKEISCSILFSKIRWISGWSMLDRDDRRWRLGQLPHCFESNLLKSKIPMSTVLW